MGWLADKLQWLSDTQTEHDGVEVTYARQDVGSVTLTARLGRTAFRLSQDLGQSRLEFNDADFHIPVADLVIDNEAITPARGDRITYDGHVYEVQAPRGEQPARHADAYGIDWRVHTKRIS